MYITKYRKYFFNEKNNLPEIEKICSKEKVLYFLFLEIYKL